MKKTEPTIWKYKGVNVHPAGYNSSGIRWTALMDLGFFLKADTKEGMRELITHYQKKGKKNG